MTPPKRVWVDVDSKDGSVGCAYTDEESETRDLKHLVEYRLVKPKREVVAYVIRQGTKRGQGRYFYEPSEDWIDEKDHATRYCSAQHAGDTRCNGAEPFDESRTVRLVRRSTT